MIQIYDMHTAGRAARDIRRLCTEIAELAQEAAGGVITADDASTLEQRVGQLRDYVIAVGTYERAMLEENRKRVEQEKAAAEKKAAEEAAAAEKPAEEKKA